MQMKASNLLVVVIIFISKINDTKAACYWNGAESCLVYCINNNPTTIGTDIEDQWEQREHCHDKFELRLRTLPYPNGTIDSFWFIADVRVVTLEVFLNEVRSVSADAFNSDAFRTVKKLIFESFGVPLIVNGIFNGLNVLETINIRGARGVSRIETGVLDSLTELQELTFEQTSKSDELNIDGLTGSADLSKLEYVKIKYNLVNSIKKSTFVGLTNVKRLDLSSCYIYSIEDNSFDPISETIEELDLSGNALTTLTYGVFSRVLPNIKTINVSLNKWDCVCDLMAFRLFIEEYQQHFIGYDCATPTHCQISNILESDCFDTCEIPLTTTTDVPSTTTTPVASTNTAPETSTTTTSTDTNLILGCSNDLETAGTVSIDRPIGYMTISENEYGDANLNVETEQDANSLVVIRFNRKQNFGEILEIDCFSRNEVASIPITDMASDVLYSYCLMQKSSTSVSPLDCISYMKRQDDPVWLPESSKTLTITLVVVFLLLSIVFGMAIAFCLMRHNRFCNQQSNNVNESKDALSYGADRNITDEPSNIYTSNTILGVSNSLGNYMKNVFMHPLKKKKDYNDDDSEK